MTKYALRAMLPSVRSALAARLSTPPRFLSTAATAGTSAYSASKASLDAMIRAVALEVGPAGIRAVDGDKRREIVVRRPEELRADDAQIKALPLRVGQAGLIHLGQVVNFKTTKVVEPILRDDGHRRAALMVNLGGRDIEGYVRDAEQRIKEQVKLPDGYIVEFGGQFKNLHEARTKLISPAR